MIEGKLIGIDHGIKRIGIATSDASGLIARELCIINRKSRAEDFKRINQIATEQHAIGYVIGIPNNDTPDDVYTQADTVRKWVERFSETTHLPIVLWDEQLSSIDARELAKERGRGYRDHIDDLAARVILQSYLDAIRDGLATPPPRSGT